MDDVTMTTKKEQVGGDILEEITGRNRGKVNASKMDLDDFLQLLSEFNKAWHSLPVRF
jgi:hypothetical protein